MGWRRAKKLSSLENERGVAGKLFLRESLLYRESVSTLSSISRNLQPLGPFTSCALSLFFLLSPSLSFRLFLSLFPPELYLRDSLDREQPSFVTGIPSFFPLFLLLSRISGLRSAFALFSPPRSPFFLSSLFFFSFCFHSPSSFSTFAGALNTKESDISVALRVEADRIRFIQFTE